MSADDLRISGTCSECRSGFCSRCRRLVRRDGRYAEMLANLPEDEKARRESRVAEYERRAELGKPLFEDRDGQT